MGLQINNSESHNGSYMYRRLIVSYKLYTCQPFLGLYVLHTATCRISDVESVMCGDKEKYGKCQVGTLYAYKT